MNVATRIHNAGMDTQTRIHRLVAHKRDTSPEGVNAYWDLLHTELAQYCHTQDLTYAAAELLDTAIDALATTWPQEATGAPWSDEHAPRAPDYLPAGWIATDGHTA